MRVRVRVPATSANLGPGFHEVGMTVALYNEVTQEEADRVSVAVEGEGSGRLDAGAKNVVARGAALAFEIAGRAFPGARLRCVNRIPLSRGLGSSPAAWVGGLVAAKALMGGPPDRGPLLPAPPPAGGPTANRGPPLPAGLTPPSEGGPPPTPGRLPGGRDRGSDAPPAGRRERCDVGTASPDLTRRLGRQYDLSKVYL